MTHFVPCDLIKCLIHRLCGRIFSIKTSLIFDDIPVIINCLSYLQQITHFMKKYRPYRVDPRIHENI